MNADTPTKTSVISQAKAAHAVWAKVGQLLKIEGSAGGMIVERAKSTLLAGSFEAKNGELVAAEGELIENVKPHFDYCFARM